MSLKEYLCDIGFKFDTDSGGKLKARKSLGSSFARVVGKGNSSGADILSLLNIKLRSLENVTILENSRALRLLEESGIITGVLIYNKKKKISRL